jgi:hypothetical protein
MEESLNETESLTKPKQKKERSEAQKNATKKMLSALDEKKMKLKALKDKLNNAPPIETTDETEIDTDDLEFEPEPKKAKPKIEPKAPKKAPAPPASKPKKEPKIIYESASEESEEEVIVVKKKKKPPKKKTIIYESESEEEESPPPPRTRETKTQQNKSSFKITPSEAKKPEPVYYFA